MKINGRDNNIVNLDEAYSGDRVRKSERKRNAEQAHKGEQTNAAGDMVNISSKGAQIQQIKSMIQNISDVRHDRVDALKQKWESGGYQINADQVAQSMVKDHLLLLAGA